MARFDRKSRYAKLQPVKGTDPRGREILLLPIPEAPAPLRIVGTHLRKQGQRLDHLAARYLKDPNGFWRICEANDVLIPDALAEADEIDIPEPQR